MSNVEELIKKAQKRKKLKEVAKLPISERSFDIYKLILLTLIVVKLWFFM